MLLIIYGYHVNQGGPTTAVSYRELHITSGSVLDPCDIRRDTCDNAMSAVTEPETVDANNYPSV